MYLWEHRQRWGWRNIPGVFLKNPPSYFLRQGLSPNPRLTFQLRWGSACLWSWDLRHTDPCLTLHRCWGFELRTSYLPSTALNHWAPLPSSSTLLVWDRVSRGTWRSLIQLDCINNELPGSSGFWAPRILQSLAPIFMFTDTCYYAWLFSVGILSSNAGDTLPLKSSLHAWF